MGRRNGRSDASAGSDWSFGVQPAIRQALPLLGVTTINLKVLAVRMSTTRQAPISHHPGTMRFGIHGDAWRKFKDGTHRDRPARRDSQYEAKRKEPCRASHQIVARTASQSCRRCGLVVARCFAQLACCCPLRRAHKTDVPEQKLARLSFPRNFGKPRLQEHRPFVRGRIC